VPGFPLTLQSPANLPLVPVPTSTLFYHQSYKITGPFVYRDVGVTLSLILQNPYHGLGLCFHCILCTSSNQTEHASLVSFSSFPPPPLTTFPPDAMMAMVEKADALRACVQHVDEDIMLDDEPEAMYSTDEQDHHDDAMSVSTDCNDFNYCQSIWALPPEIRCLVYRELLLSDSAFRLGHHGPYSHETRRATYPAILRTCKTIFEEASNVLYGDNTFYLGKLRLQGLIISVNFSRSHQPQTNILGVVSRKHRRPQRDED
jgi:hypothetical protein